MTDAHAALVLGLTQATLTVAIVVDRWVHRITGGKSVEVKLDDLCDEFKIYREAMKGALEDLHEKASDFQSAQQVKVSEFAIRLAEINEHMRYIDSNVERLERRRSDRVR